MGVNIMSRKDDFLDDIDDYLTNPFHDERQYEDYIESEEEDDESYRNEDDDLKLANLKI